MESGVRIDTALSHPVRHRRPASRRAVSPEASVSAGNSLLAALPRKDRLRFIAACEQVALVASNVLYEPCGRIGHVYFPVEGSISLAASLDGSGQLEVGMVGSEGMVGSPLVLGVATSFLQARVQGAGSALRIDADSFSSTLAQCPVLQETLARYNCVRMAQLARAIACNRFHVVEARLARWLLMTQDRARSDEIHITHEILAPILGVRRLGITKAATSLQNLGFIGYSRGHITILDRPGLMSASCSCYQADLDAYRRILGW